MRGRYASATVLGLAIGCAGAPAFVCSDSEDCADGSFTGICQDNGYCSFGDPGCPSGQRFGDHAPGGLAGTCVDAEGTSTGAASTDGGETTFTTLDGASLEQGTSDDGSSGAATTGVGMSSTGMSVDDTTGNPDTMTTSPGETDPNDTNDPTDPTECGMQPGDECSACIYENCCEETIACANDKPCLCFFDCQGMMAMTMGECLEFCGPSAVLDAMTECLAVSCPMLCGIP